jgi:hypothetical protein
MKKKHKKISIGIILKGYLMLVLLLGITNFGWVITTNLQANKDIAFGLAFLLGIIITHLTYYGFYKLKKENENKKC